MTGSGWERDGDALQPPEDEDEADPCDCADKVPADLPPEGWICPKCDAQWFPEGDDD